MQKPCNIISGRTYATIRYAVKQSKKIVNLAD